MTNRPDIDNYLELFLNDRPLMDVRAPVEFDKGTMPNSSNLPLLDDEQRAAVGTRYKDAGQDEAIKLGLELIADDTREQRLRDWKAFVAQHPDGYLYCFRGGLRSRTTQAWLKERGIDYPLIRGGYKAMRQFLLDQLEISRREIPLVILSGLTGSGKTHVLKKIRHHVDLEGLANHRGSAFGRDARDYQPGQIDFENTLSVALLRHRHNNPGVAVMLEDEGKLIGRLCMPLEFYQAMVQAPRVILECSLEQRIRMTSDDYFGHAWPEYVEAHDEQARDKFASFVLDSLARIKKRLGGERHKKIHAMFLAALEQLFETGSSHGFDEGVRILLEEYYDPMYRYQLSQKPVDILFRGSETEVIDWANTHLQEGQVQHENAVSGSTR